MDGTKAQQDFSPLKQVLYIFANLIDGMLSLLILIDP